ncbi:hypothetical protein BD309DRAFT_874008 [Dichomitus squalens]|uniref:Uncharacterized protein n=1 Tax=Dichomitus squalens TaxID=114155 RepID=A0A4Q9NGK6_9APHY|nr:hypothetical protein BD309DRAFT_874008 [Dichomitus squalens]TBU51656.1 hypothetical protein BD310DRAFT_833822 [Dichomitus squalens]
MSTAATTSAGPTMEAEHLPAIQVIASEEHASVSTLAIRATGLEECPNPFDLPITRHRPPSPARRVSSVFLDDTPEAECPGGSERPSSSASHASSITLSCGQAMAQPSTPGPTYVSGPYTAEPGAITADLPEPDPKEVEKKVYLAPVPATFCSNLRYQRREMLDLTRLEAPITQIPAKNAIPARPEVLGKGWRQYVHPEGSRYFRYQNFYTNTWLFDKTNLVQIEKAMVLIQDELMRHHDVSKDDIEIGLELSVDEDGDILGCYYIVDTRKEDTFWLSPIAASFLSDTDTVKILGKEHLGYATAVSYWTHMYMFPHDRELSAETVEGLKSDLNYFMFDKQTSKSSTAPYNLEDAHRLVQTLKEISIEPDRAARPQYVVIVGRLLAIVFQERFIRYHGERYAQLDSDRSVYLETHHDRHLWFRMFSWIFFWTPQIYYDRLSITWVDSKVNYDHWKTFIGELQSDWAASITPSTVILSANVGFLAIQSVDNNGLVVPNRSMGQIVSYISTMLTIGNIVACTILARQHRETMHRYAEAAAAYLDARAGSKQGMEVLAILFSIPTAFFAWGVLTFLVAIIWLCLWGTSLATRVAVCVVIGVCTLLIAWIVHNGEWQAQQGISTLSAKMRRMHKLVKKAPVRMATSFRTLSQRAMTILSGPLSPRKKSRWSGPDPVDTPGDIGLRTLSYGSDDAV